MWQVLDRKYSPLLWFGKGECELAVNRQQGYDNGKFLPQVLIGNECLIYTINGFCKDKFPKMCELVSDM